IHAGVSPELVPRPVGAADRCVTGQRGWIKCTGRCQYALASIQVPDLVMPFPDLVHPALDVYESAVTMPADCADFWQETLQQARAVGGAATMVPAETTLKLVEVFDVTFPGFGG